MRPTTIRSLSAFSLTTATLTLALSGPAFAASACKGLEEAVCGTTEACRWQAGYTRKDGIEVASHCRSTGKAKAAAPQTPAPEAAAGDGVDKAS